VRIEEAEDGDPLCRLQEGSQMTAGEVSRGQGSGLRTAHPGTALPSVRGRHCRVILRGAAPLTICFFKKVPPPAACGEQTSITSFWREKRESEELCQNHPHLRDDGSLTYRSDRRHGEK